RQRPLASSPLLNLLPPFGRREHPLAVRMRDSQRPAFSSLRGPTHPRERRAGNLRGGCPGVSPRDNRRPPPLNHLLLAHWIRWRLLARSLLQQQLRRLRRPVGLSS